jgi:hypothetical protein
MRNLFHQIFHVRRQSNTDRYGVFSSATPERKGCPFETAEGTPGNHTAGIVSPIPEDQQLEESLASSSGSVSGVPAPTSCRKKKLAQIPYCVWIDCAREIVIPPRAGEVVLAIECPERPINRSGSLPDDGT